MIIDAHAHVYPDKIADKASESVGKFYDLKMDCGGGSVSGLLKAGEEAGIDKFLIHSVATTPHQVVSIDNFIIRTVNENPGKFIGFATGHPDFQEAEEELARAMENGLRGVKLHPDFQEFAITDRRLWPLYKFCERNGLPILFHTGDPRYEYSNPHLVLSLLELFPDIKLICAHFGGWGEWDDAAKILPQTNVMVDCSSSFYAMTDSGIMELFEAFTEDRVVFGSDYPMWQPGAELERLRSLHLNDAALNKILSENILKFLGIADEADI